MDSLVTAHERLTLKGIGEGTDQLEEALHMNKSLMKDYLQKESVHEIWRCAIKPEEELLIDERIAQTKATKVRLLRKMAETIEKH